MSFCKWSSQVVVSNSTAVENIFINEFMPSAPDMAVKVYLYGLYKCANNINNTAQDFCAKFKLTEQDLISIFTYWQELGLVQLLHETGFEVRYLPIKNGTLSLRKLDTNKYKEFNSHVQEIISGRMLTPTELNEYYYLIEVLGLERDALLMVVKYCAGLKGNNVSYSYISTVAKNWAYEGLTTCEKIEERISLQEHANTNLKEIFKTLGMRSIPNTEDYQQFLKWTTTEGIDFDLLLTLAKIAKKKHGGMNKLNSLVDKCVVLKITEPKAAVAYFEAEDASYEIAKTVCRNFGVRYDNLETVVEEYIYKWLNMGFEGTTLALIAKECFKNNYKSLTGMNAEINDLFEKGCIDQLAVETYYKRENASDAEIIKILKLLGLKREINYIDRASYTNWFTKWNTPKEVFNHALESCKAELNPIASLNKLLSMYYNAGVTTVEAAKKFKTTGKPAPVSELQNNKAPRKRDYTKEQLNSLYDNVKEVEL